MSTPDPNEPVIVGEFESELEAGFVKTRLEDAGVPAWLTGQLTAGFRAEAPGRVRVLVRSSDVERAREALREEDGEASAG